MGMDHRCTFALEGERCAYCANIYRNSTEPSRDAYPEHGLCWGHFEAGANFEKARETWEASRRDVPVDFDYSSEALVKATLKRFEGRHA